MVALGTESIVVLYYALNNENKHGLTACRARPQAADASGKAAARDAALPFFSCPPNF